MLAHAFLAVATAIERDHTPTTPSAPARPDRLKLDRLAASRADIVAISARIKELDAQIPALLKALGCTLTAIHGIGVTAMTLLTKIGDPHRFSTEARFSRWCGVAPVAMSSGEGDGPPRSHRLDLLSFVGSPSGSFGLVLCPLPQPRHALLPGPRAGRRAHPGPLPRPGRRPTAETSPAQAALLAGPTAEPGPATGEPTLESGLTCEGPVN